MPKKEEKEEFIIIENEENSSLASKLKKIKKELKKCQQEKSEYLTGWQRAKADFINARKEEEENRKKIQKFAKSELLLELLSLVDSFDMALGSRELWSKLDKNWQSGIENIYSQLNKILENHNLEVIETKGKKFNPAEHESVGSVNVKDKSRNHVVIEEISKGYKLHNKVLRPAKVKVGNYQQ